MPDESNTRANESPAALVGGIDRYIDADGVRLHYVEVGTGPVVVLLHGFPEFWYAWREQMPALASAGFRVVALDMRGYNLSEKPPGVASYAMSRLVADVREVARKLGDGRVHLAGHDWGGSVAWAVALHAPEVVRRLAILNAPHPVALARELRTRDQLRRSWYIFGFQLPWLPEAGIRAGHFRLIRRLLRHEPARAGAYTAADIARYVGALEREGALTAMVNYYRAALRHRPPPLPRAARIVRQPTLVVWGERDRYLSPRLLDGLERWVPGVRMHRLPDASHWVMADAPDTVNRLLIDHFRSTDA